MGLDFGLLGKEGGNLRATQKKEKQAKVSQKRRKMIQMSSGATNGLSSSLVFTPVQGIELANPEMMQGKVDAANAKWFSESSGFQSALPQSKPGLFGRTSCATTAYSRGRRGTRLRRHRRRA